MRNNKRAFYRNLIVLGGEPMNSEAIRNANAADVETEEIEIEMSGCSANASTGFFPPAP